MTGGGSTMHCNCIIALQHMTAPPWPACLVNAGCRWFTSSTYRALKIWK